MNSESETYLIQILKGNEHAMFEFILAHDLEEAQAKGERLIKDRAESEGLRVKAVGPAQRMYLRLYESED